MYASLGYLQESLLLLRDCTDSHDVVPYNSLITTFAKKNLVDASKLVFDRMPARNAVTWSSIISAYSRNNMNVDALLMFNQMLLQKIKPNAHTLVSVLNACAGLGAIDQGEWIVSYINKNKKDMVENNAIVSTAIINMYCKCGYVDKAVEFFENASTKRALSTWNTLIFGLGIHGRRQDAIHMFSRLESTRFLIPDHVSFLSVLTACNHSGLVTEARRYFVRMNEYYHIEPQIEHYGCLVDVLGRAGHVAEAYDITRRMVLKPDSMIWGSLVSACRKWGNAEIGEIAAAKVIELDPWDSGGYVNLANGYGHFGDFEGVGKVRKDMGKKGVRKEVGCSMIEVNGMVSEFVADGVMHHQIGEIREALKGLNLNLRNVDVNMNI